MPGSPLWLALPAVVLSVSGGWFALDAYLKRRRIADTPTARVRSAAQGYVELVGRAQMLDGLPVEAPLSREPVCWYRYAIYGRSGRSERWGKLEGETSEALFALDDGTGRCVIDPDGADVATPHRSVRYGQKRYPEHWDRGGALHALVGNYRYVEEWIAPGDRLYALGRLRTHAGITQLDADRERVVRETLADFKRDPARARRLFDRNADGVIDATEWEAARRVAAQRADRALRDTAPSDDVHLL